MIIDIGASEKAKRGDINFIYKYDKSYDTRHEQYDKYFPIKNDGIVYYYENVMDIINKLNEINGFDKNNTFLFIHSFEHNYYFFILLEQIAKHGCKVVIVTPNATFTDKHDKEDKTHLFSFTKYSLHNLLSQFYTNIEFKDDKEDLFVIASN